MEQTRRQFLKNVAALSVASAIPSIALGQECLDEIVLNVKLVQSKHDLLTDVWQNGTHEDRQNIYDAFLAPARKMYTEQFGIPISTSYFGPWNAKKEEGTIETIYSGREEFKKIFLNTNKSYRKRDFQKEYRGTAAFAIPERNFIWIFAPTKDTFDESIRWSRKKNLELYCTYAGYLLVHEIGHNIGLDHQEEQGMKRALNIMYPEFINDKKSLKNGWYEFNEEYNQKLKTMTCP